MLRREVWISPHIMSSRGLQKLFSHIVKITSQHLIITNNLTVRLPSLCLPTSTNVSPPGFSLWPCINWKYRFFSRLKSTVPIQFPDHAFWIPLVACPVVSFSFCRVPCLFCLSVLPLRLLIWAFFRAAEVIFRESGRTLSPAPWLQHQAFFSFLLMNPPV